MPSPSAHLILLRHGETEANASGTWQGHGDTPLTVRGIAQGQAAAQRLASMPCHALYSSDLPRARQTALFIAATTGLHVSEDARLREMHVGVFQGLNRQQILSQHPDLWQHFRESGPDFTIPQGESPRQFHERIVAACEDIAARHAGETVVVVTHGGALAVMLREALGLPIGGPRRYALTNTALNCFDRHAEGWHLISWGDAAHLQAECAARRTEGFYG